MDLFDNNALNMPMVALRGLVVFLILHCTLMLAGKSISAVKTAMITNRTYFFLHKRICRMRPKILMRCTI